ncbi:hypothetical protein [Ahrensia sp. R2A130]|nr:hypothetical protein [Ahrensia sp. R2A130]
MLLPAGISDKNVRIVDGCYVFIRNGKVVSVGADQRKQVCQ